MIKPLTFIVDLKDWASPQIANIHAGLRGLNKLNRQTRREWMNLGTSAGGVWAMTESMSAMVEPGLEMRQSLDAIAAADLTLDDSGLNALKESAFNTSEQFGVTTLEVLEGTGAINASMKNLTTGELGRLTELAAGLGKATRTGVSESAGYLATLSGLFEKEAQRMGRVSFATQATGQSAVAARLFGMTTADYAGAFEGLGATGANQGMALSEQLAVLGMLKRYGSPTEFETMYTGLLESLPMAEDKLGLSLRGRDGNFLSMPALLSTLQSQTEGLGQGAKFALFDEAFGEGGKAVMALIDRVDELNAHIGQIESPSALTEMKKAADKSVSSWAQMSQAWWNLKAQAGLFIEDGLSPLTGWLAGVFTTLRRWMDMFPNLTRWIAYATLGMMAFITAIAMFGTVWATAKLAWAGLLLMKTGLAVAATIATGGMNLIVLGVLAVAAGVTALTIYWDDLVAAFSNMNWVQSIKGAFTQLFSWLRPLLDVLDSAWSKITAIGDWFSDDDTGIDVNAQQSMMRDAMPYAHAHLSAASGQNAPVPDSAGTPAMMPGTGYQGGQAQHIGAVNIYPRETSSASELARQMEMWIPA